jgi:hypothetical protein
VRTLVNHGTSAQAIGWCVVPAHWVGDAHVTVTPFQGSAFGSGFQVGSLCITNTQTIPPDTELVIDETAGNGVGIMSQAAAVEVT